ncbi:MAG: glycosyltransferase [Alphaproteobacteria bacterium]|nr:glycosyltransferase [Alphaproteobacteria bacterium]
MLVDLEWGPRAGGHVKCWERFAEAAAMVPDAVDLTVYFLGHAEGEIEVASNARYRLLAPLLGTNRFRLLKQGAGDTDLAPYHPKLARLLAEHDVLHATDVFTFARTALRVAQRNRLPFVTSIHTDVAAFTRVYAREIIERATSRAWMRRLLLERLDLPDRFARQMGRRVAAMVAASDRVLVSRPSDRALAAKLVGAERVSRLRRGVDSERFSPRHRDQERLRRHFGIPEDRPILLFAGRIDDSKRAMVAAEAARKLMDAGHPVHSLFVGEGADMEGIRRLLGPTATLPGSLSQDMLAWIYASADVFVFPSESEVMPNVVAEAKASGLPVVVSARDGGAQLVERSGVDGIVVQGRDPADWARAIAPLVADAVKRAEVAYQARKSVIERWPSWLDVLRADLLPVWQAAARQRRA